jgi:hypothetical protein
MNERAGITAQYNCVPTMKRIEIHTTYRCNLKCPQCINLCSQAPSREDFTIENMKKFISESIELKWEWEWIVLHGGESCLHPQFFDLCQLLVDYRNAHCPETRLILTTNGYTQAVCDRVNKAASMGFVISNSHRENGFSYFCGHLPYCVSPTDTGEKYTEGCSESSECGIALTNRGYYECSPAAAAWRVMGYEPLAKSLQEVSVEKMKEGFKIHCKHCGFSRVGATAVGGDKTITTGTWERKLKEYELRNKNV